MFSIDATSDEKAQVISLTSRNVQHTLLTETIKQGDWDAIQKLELMGFFKKYASSDLLNVQLASDQTLKNADLLVDAIFQGLGKYLSTGRFTPINRFLENRDKAFSDSTVSLLKNHAKSISMNLLRAELEQTQDSLMDLSFNRRYETAGSLKYIAAMLDDQDLYRQANDILQYRRDDIPMRLKDIQNEKSLAIAMNKVECISVNSNSLITPAGLAYKLISIDITRMNAPEMSSIEFYANSNTDNYEHLISTNIFDDIKTVKNFEKMLSLILNHNIEAEYHIRSYEQVVEYINLYSNNSSISSALVDKIKQNNILNQTITKMDEISLYKNDPSHFIDEYKAAYGLINVLNCTLKYSDFNAAIDISKNLISNIDDNSWHQCIINNAGFINQAILNGEDEFIGLLMYKKFPMDLLMNTDIIEFTLRKIIDDIGSERMKSMLLSQERASEAMGILNELINVPNVKIGI